MNSSYAKRAAGLLFSASLLLPATPDSLAASSEAGSARGLYETQCASCHGLTGDGAGPAAYLVYPRPRDFRTGIYRFRSTPSGALPTDGDVARTIRRGLPGTGMPAFSGLLTEEQILSLVDVVKSFSPAFASAEPPTPLAVPEAPPRTEELVTRGRQVYKELGCAACHGAEGRGDGPASSSLKSEEGYDLPAMDFTRGVFKSGDQPEDLYRTFLTGLNGAPMPSFQNMFTKESKLFDFENPGWALVYYVLSLQPDAAEAGTGAGAVIEVGTTADASVFKNAYSPAWDRARDSVVTLRPLWTRNEFPRSVSVRALRDDSSVAIRLSWDDASANMRSLGPTDFPDKAAVSFPTGEGIPFIGMGFKTDEDGRDRGMVNIWCWRADRQEQHDKGRFADIQDRYDLAAVDWYPFKKGWRPGQQESVADDEVLSHNPTFLTGWGAGNPVSNPVVREGSITEFDALGFGTLTAQPPREQNVTGASQWRVGEWAVVFVRDLYTGGDGDVILSHRDRVPISFAVWDGQYRDRNGTKSVSNWHWLDLGTKEAAK